MVHSTNVFKGFVPTKGDDYRQRLDDTNRRQDVRGRQWRFVTFDGITFFEQ